jgi:uncharacterized integral membrane protein
MRDAGTEAAAMPGAPEAPAVPAVPGGAVPGGGGVVEPAPPAEPGADVVEPEAVHLKRTRISGLWVGITVAAVVLLLLLVFILQNNSYVMIYFFGWGGSFPLGVALLLAAISGVLLVAIPGYGRIIQLRRSFRKANPRK